MAGILSAGRLSRGCGLCLGFLWVCSTLLSLLCDCGHFLPFSRGLCHLALMRRLSLPTQSSLVSLVILEQAGRQVGCFRLVNFVN